MLKAHDQPPAASAITQTIPEMFRRQAVGSPDAVALVGGDLHLTYDVLNRRANQLAHYLCEQGVRPEELVGVYLDRSVEMAVALLGVLKAGGGYVPLDPAYPADRLKYVLQDAGINVVVTAHAHRHDVDDRDIKVVCLSRDRAAIATKPDVAPPVLIDPANLAYVLYTSGSTGQPKGVMVTHRSLVNHSHAVMVAYDLTARDRVLQFASMNFDVAAEELYPTWLAGGLVFLRMEHLLSLEAFGQSVTEAALTVLNLPASYWHEWVTHLARHQEKPSPWLRAVIAGSEIVLPERLRQWREIAAGHIRWWNAYGPTEATITTTVYEHCADAVTTIPIGRPLDNMTTHLLDEWGRPVAPGVSGELCIGGIGVARGYLHRPGLTAEKFVPDPFSLLPGGRLYRTGDLARRMPDGQIEYLDRIDRQVKIRGFRVELGEIEAALRQHPAVHEAAVVVQPVAGSTHLTAYLVREDNQELSEKMAQAFVQAHLPDYMIPARYVLVPSLPLMPNGKIDRRALSAATAELSATDVGFPRTPLEDSLAAIWRQVLAVAPIGIHDDFFELGGNSLTALQAISRINAALRTPLTMPAFFENPTIAQLALWLSNNETALDPPRLPPIRPYVLGANTPIPLSWGQQQLWLVEQLYPGNTAYNILFSLRLSGSLDIPLLTKCLNQILARHEAIRTAIIMVDGQPTQRIMPASTIPLPLIDIHQLPQAEAEAEAVQAARVFGQRAFQMSQAPLLHAGLIRIADQNHLLLLSMHHIITDGWSLVVMTNELAALYGAGAEKKEPTLSPLPIQYKDVALWQRRWLQPAILADQIAYWQTQLASLPPPLTLPGDHPKPARYTFAGARQWFVLPKVLSDALYAAGQQAKATLFMTLLASYGALLHRYTGQPEMIIGAPIAGRHQRETEPLIGYFVNVLALRLNFQSAPSFQALVRQTREVVLEAYTHQDVPIERLVEMCRPQRISDQNPLFQTTFTLQNMPQTAFEAGGIQARPLELDTGTALFDLRLEFSVQPQNRLAGFIEYNTALFERETITQLLGYYVALLQSVTAHPDQALSTLLSFIHARPQEMPPTPLQAAEDRLAQRRASLSARRTKLSADQLALFEKHLRGNKE